MLCKQSFTWRGLDCVLNIRRQHSATLLVVNPVSFEKRATVPEQIIERLSIKFILYEMHADLSQVFRLRIRVKRLAPRPNVGMGPETKTDFPQSFKTLKRSLKSSLVHSDSRRNVSFTTTWSTTLLMEEGSEGSRSRSLSTMTGTVAPEKLCVMTLKKRISLVMESPMINVVGGGRG